MKKMLKNKKGFTLIEIIVVLVIIAILAAAAVPSMLNFVRDAQGKAYVAEARVGYIAAQSVSTTLSATGKMPDAAADKPAAILSGADSNFAALVSDVPGTFSSAVVNDEDQVTGITYTSEDGNYEVVISNGQATVTQK